MEIINNILYSNALFFAVILSAVIGRIMQDAKSSIFKMWSVFFVGTFMHELAHFLVSFLTLGFPYKFSVIPKKNKDNNNLFTMGHVKSFNTKWYNVAIISMAPLLLLATSYFVNKYFFTYCEATALNFFIWVFLMVSLIFSSIPSSVDFKNVIRGNFMLNLIGMFIFPVFYFVLYYIGVVEWIFTRIG